LTIRADLINDFSELGLKTHVEHAIRFVHDEVRHATKVHFSRLDHVNETAWSRNNNFDTALEVTDLRPFGSATIETSVLDARGRSKLVGFLLDLNGKLTSGSENKDDGAVT
jgi:hypothetical protein